MKKPEEIKSHESLLKLFNHIAPLNDVDCGLIRSSFSPLLLKKGEFLLQEGEINRYIAFITKGLVRYFVRKNEEESTFEFTAENEFVADYQSFRHLTPSVQNIQAIEDCELLIIEKKDVDRIFQDTEFGDRLGRSIIEHRFDIMVNQLLSIYMHNPEQRYLNFQKNYFSLNQRIPQYLIASYVGVKPESLSRIRKRAVKGIS